MCIRDRYQRRVREYRTVGMSQGEWEETSPLKPDKDPDQHEDLDVASAHTGAQPTTCARLITLLRKPRNTASLMVVSALIIIGIASAIAYIQRSQDPQTARFVVVSDWGTGNSVQASVATALTRTVDSTKSRFALSLGNNFYQAGVTSTTDELWRSQWYDMYYEDSTTYPMQVPWYAVVGDVDYKGNVSCQLEYTSPQTNHQDMWNMPAMNYVMKLQVQDADSLYILMLDTTPLAHPNGANTVSQNQEQQLQHLDGVETIEWVRSMLAEYQGQNVIVAGHHPTRVLVDSRLGTAGGEYETGVPARGMEILDQLMQDHNVQAYLSGHLPVMSYFLHENVNYFIAGTGGCPSDVLHGCSTSGTTVDKSVSSFGSTAAGFMSVSYTHLRAHETPEHLVCRLLLEKKKKN
eukprot:TRINITY_DN11544_c0_g1_i1.p1 TRINITY_DN11544_c0_g1~~TRINITY_DN11544_c0_g1_i1.p1  ORF type:complete len:406 (-),score=85.18 TRINITY_DN11544_c0_g1_i1:77-1294(-)